MTNTPAKSMSNTGSKTFPEAARRWKRAALATAALALAATTAQAGVQTVGLKAERAAGGVTMPLFGGLETMQLHVTTGSDKAKAYFGQGLALTYGFNHAAALRSFREAQRMDPDCALSYWGEALSLGPNVNAAMHPAANRPAVRAMDRARKLARTATPKERALIAALDRRYYDGIDVDQSDEDTPSRAELNRAYADAMAEVAARFPQDDDVALLYAMALIDLAPRDYWEADRTTPKGRTAEILATLERVIRRNPDHTAAVRLYIHVVEASTLS